MIEHDHFVVSTTSAYYNVSYVHSRINKQTLDQLIINKQRIQHNDYVYLILILEYSKHRTSCTQDAIQAAEGLARAQISVSSCSSSMCEYTL